MLRKTDSENQDHHLKLPDQKKNHCLSPPASPPVGWKTIEEEGPVTADKSLSNNTQNLEGQTNGGTMLFKYQQKDGTASVPQIVIENWDERHK